MMLYLFNDVVPFDTGITTEGYPNNNKYSFHIKTSKAGFYVRRALSDNG